MRKPWTPVGVCHTDWKWAQRLRGRSSAASVVRDTLIGRRVHYVALEGLDIGDPVDDAPSDLHVRRALAGPPPALKGAVRNGPAVRQFFLVQASWFHCHLLFSNSQRLQEDEGVKEKERQVSVLRRPAQRRRGRKKPSKLPARMRESNRIGRYSRRDVTAGRDLTLPTERSFCVSLSLRIARRPQKLRRPHTFLRFTIESIA